MRAQPVGPADEPAAGSMTLRVISPEVLEISRVDEKQPDPAWPGGWPELGAGLESPTLALQGLHVRADGADLQITAVGWRRRARFADFHRRDLRVGESLYLRVQRPLAGPHFWTEAFPENARVRVADERGELIPAGRALRATADPRRESPAIHVNQEGYVPAFPKRAMVGYYLGDLGELALPNDRTFWVIDAASGTRVWRGALQPRRDVGYRSMPTPYQEVGEADFTEFRRPGAYRLQVPGLGVSLPFRIDEGIAMGFARTYALGLYEQRCGAAIALPFSRFVHDACHLAPAQIPVPDNDPQFAWTWKTIAGYGGDKGKQQTAPALVSEANSLFPFERKGAVDVSGGHHDAGDYSKYTENSAQLVHYLLFTADSIRGAKGLDNLGIPESGDGISDVLQEAKWEADYLAKLQDEDGGFYFLVYPKNREYESDVTPDRGDPQIVWPKNTSVTAAAVGALAECASSPEFKRRYPEAAAEDLRKAELGWRFLMAAIGRYGKEGSYQKITFYSDDYGPDDELAWAAAAMYAATGDSRYQQMLFDWFPDPGDPATFRWGWWRLSEGWGNAIRDYAFAARSGRLRPDRLDPHYLAACEQQVVAAADQITQWSEESAYGTAFPNPTKAVNAAGWYFSLDQAADVAVAWQIQPKPEYLDALVSAMNYEGGCNPPNRSYLTGMGLMRQREIVSQFAWNSRRVMPPSGIPIGNVTAAFSYSGLYRTELRDVSYPTDDAGYGPYPMYDRWTDVSNVTTEYIAVDQARALLSSVCLAAQTEAAKTPWTAVAGDIALPIAEVAPGTAVKVRLRLPAGAPEGEPRMVWEARDQEPAFGKEFTIVPKHAGQQWVEAEAQWPDGRRVFAAAEFTSDAPTIAWFEGDAPLTHHDEGNLHEVTFTASGEPPRVTPGDVLWAKVQVDPQHPPSEILLAWNDGKSWEHRAYWGKNEITYGTNDSPGRHPAGPLPSGSTVELRIPAAEVGLSTVAIATMSLSAKGAPAKLLAAGRSH